MGINRMGDNHTDETKILIIAGPSGSGKNSILEALLAQSDIFVRLVTATTREPRDGEIHTKDYYFISKDAFLEGIKSGQIPEYWHAKDTDRYYGTYLPDLTQKTKDGKIIIAQVQAEGIKYFKERFNAIAIMITAESEDELIGRINARSTMTPEELSGRMALIKKETEELNAVCDYTVRNANGKLDEAVAEVTTIVTDAGFIT